MTGQKFVWDLRNFILRRKSCTSHAISVFIQSLADVSTGKGHQGTELVARKSRMEGHMAQDTEYTKSQDCAKQSTGRQLPHSRCAAAGRAQPRWAGGEGSQGPHKAPHKGTAAAKGTLPANWHRGQEAFICPATQHPAQAPGRQDLTQTSTFITTDLHHNHSKKTQQLQLSN